MCGVGQTELCADCNALLDRRIARWWHGTERATYEEAASEFGLVPLALQGRVKRLLGKGVLYEHISSVV